MAGSELIVLMLFAFKEKGFKAIHLSALKFYPKNANYRDYHEFFKFFSRKTKKIMSDR